MSEKLESWNEMIAIYDDKIIACTLSDKEMEVKFDTGFGSANGVRFAAWSEKWVYFPVEYDGSEWVGRASRCIGDYLAEGVG